MFLPIRKLSMKKIALIAALAAVVAAPAFANADLAQKKSCLACHATDKKLVGPSYQEVAAKYKGDAGAEAKLVAKVKNGGSGAWGQVPMPPNATVPEADIKALVKWVLAAKK